MALFKAQDRSGFNRQDRKYINNPWLLFSDSNEIQAQIIRDLLNNWYEHIALTGLKKNIRKMMSKQGRNGWYSGVLELLVHEICVLHDYPVLEYHTKRMNNVKQVDYRIKTPQCEILLEVTHKASPLISIEELEAKEHVLHFSSADDRARAVSLKLSDKHSRQYNLTDRPYFIALESHLDGTMLMDFAIALYGKLKLRCINAENKLIPLEYVFSGNGYYNQIAEVATSRDNDLAGVIAFTSINLYTMQHIECCVFLNPYYVGPKQMFFDRIATVIPDANGRIEVRHNSSLYPAIPGTPFTQLLQLDSAMLRLIAE